MARNLSLLLPLLTPVRCFANCEPGNEQSLVKGDHDKDTSSTKSTWGSYKAPQTCRSRDRTWLQYKSTIHPERLRQLIFHRLHHSLFVSSAVTSSTSQGPTGNLRSNSSSGSAVIQRGVLVSSWEEIHTGYQEEITVRLVRNWERLLTEGVDFHSLEALEARIDEAFSKLG